MFQTVLKLIFTLHTNFVYDPFENMLSVEEYMVSGDSRQLMTAITNL